MSARIWTHMTQGGLFRASNIPLTAWKVLVFWRHRGNDHVGRLFEELKRRNVVRVGVAYAVVGWLILQFVDVIAPTLALPDWFPRAVVVLLLIGLPVALLFSWAYELTPQGVKKTEEVDADESITPSTGRKLDFVIIAALVLALGYFIWERQSFVELDETVVSEPAEIVPANASIAVLPFTDLSPEGDQGYFADGLSEEILNVLVGVDALTVASRTSSFQFKGREIGVPEIAAELNVAYVLEGSVRKAGGAIRVTGQLIEAATDRHLWSDTFDRELTTENIFAIQDEIASAIVGALGEELDLGVRGDSVEVAASTTNLSAYDVFLRARETFLNRSVPSDVVDSLALLETAVQIDPGFANAWLWLGAAYVVAPGWDIGDQRDLIGLAESAADRALELDPGLAFAHAVRGFAATEHAPFDWEYNVAEQKRAIELNPKDATAQLWLGITYSNLGFFDAAKAHLNRCLELDPAYDNCKRHKGRNHMYAGDHEEAMAAFLSMNDLPAVASSDIQFAFLLIRHGQTVAARLSIELFLADHRGFPMNGWIDGIRHPDGEHGATRAEVVAWLKTAEIDIILKRYLYYGVGAYDEAPLVLRGSEARVLWLREFTGFRKSEAFKRNVRALNMLSYWRKIGFPPQCHPVGEDDFECD